MIRLEWQNARADGKPSPFDERRLADVLKDVERIQQRLKVLLPMHGFDVDELAMNARAVWMKLFELTHHLPPSRRPKLP